MTKAYLNALSEERSPKVLFEQVCILDGKLDAAFTDAASLRAEIDRLRAELAAAREAFTKIEQALLPDPNDERELSVEWLRKTIHVAIDAAKGGKS